MRTLYHATNPENAPLIWANGLLPSADGYVYLTEKIDDAVKFKSLTLSEMYIFPIKVAKKDEANIEETFDHSFSLFKCRSFSFRGAIPPDKLGNPIHWKSE